MITTKKILSDAGLQFFATGMIAFKAILDSYLLEHYHPDSFYAFGLTFPILILANTLVLCLTNAVFGTFKHLKWAESQNLQANVLSVLLVVALSLGVGVWVLLSLTVPEMMSLLSAQQYQADILAFTDSLLYWMPMQFLMVVLLGAARGAGLHKRSGVLVGCGYLIGIAASALWLSTADSGLESPLVTVNLSSALAVLLSLLALAVLLLGRLSLRRQISVRVFVQTCSAPLWRVFVSTFYVSMFALVFIFALTAVVSEQGQQGIYVLAYLVRVEQLVLILFGAFMSVLFPIYAERLRCRDKQGVSQLLTKSLSVIVVTGAAVIAVAGLAFATHVLFSDADILLSPETLIMASLWLLTLGLQGVVIFYFQLLTIFHNPALAIKVSFIRFILFAMPLLYGLEHFLGIVGIGLAIPIIHLLSFEWIKYLYRIEFAKAFEAEDSNQIQPVNG